MLSDIPDTLSICVNLSFIIIDFEKLVVKFKNIPIDLGGKVVNLILQIFSLSSHQYLHLQHALLDFVKFGLATLSLLVVDGHLK